MVREYGTHDTTIEDLTSLLPVWMPKDEESGNHALLAPIGEEIDEANDDRAGVDASITVQHAGSIPELRERGKLVDVYPETGESLEHYRARVMVEYQLVTSKGTVMDLLNGVASILDTHVEQIGYTEEHTTAAGDCRITVPASRLDSLAFTSAEFAEAVESLIAASYRVDAIVTGTFTYLSETAYSGSGGYDPTSLTSDSTKGHDGLDTNGDPKDNGGTYATVLE